MVSQQQARRFGAGPRWIAWGESASVSVNVKLMSALGPIVSQKGSEGDMPIFSGS